MKKLFFTLVLSVICGMASAQTVSISDIEIKAGEKAAFTIVVNVGDNEFSGIEFTNMVLPTGLTVVGTAVSESWDASANNDYNVDTDKTVLGAFTSLKDITIPKNQDFAIGSIELEAASNLTVDDVLTVTIPKGKFKFVPGSVAVDKDITFNVKVSNYITLDENSVALPKGNATASDVKVLRTLKAGEWSTICLPFELTADERTELFGSHKLASINGYTLEKEDGKITGIKVLFKNVSGKLTKNRPYIINVDEAKSFFIAKSKIVDAKEVTYTPTDDDDEDLPTSMIGCMKAGTVVPANSLFLSDGKFWYSVGKTKMKAFRAYFTFEDVLSSIADASSRIKFFVSDGDTQTEIQIPELMPNDGEYYNLNGLRVETPSKGIYIKDGKKVVVK